MCDDTSPCDLRTISRSERSDEYERWSVTESEKQYPNFRYQMVCSKYDFKRILGQGYRYGEARALAKLLSNTCSKARPREDSWTLPLFMLERITPLIRERTEVGDLAFVKHEHFHKHRADGTLASYTERKLLVTIEAVSSDGKVQRVRSFSGLVLVDPVVTKTFASDDISIAQFIQHVQSRLADCSPFEAYSYLTSTSVLEDEMERFALNEIQRTPFDSQLAVACMRKVTLPKGHEEPQIAIDLLERQVANILKPVRLAA